ncbi:MAG: type II secretion system major pseudopilin GspG [Pseudomonadota bacterium]
MTQHSRRVRRIPQPGFTLIELLVVLAILGLLAGLVGPQVIKFLGGSKTKTTGLQIKDFSMALDIYKIDTGRYPNSQEGLQALVTAPGSARNWNGPYLQKNNVPKDPWGFEYQYKAPGEQGRPFDIISLGADNAVGGDGENQDIHSWD